MTINYKIIIISIIILLVVVIFARNYESFIVRFDANSGREFADCSGITDCATCTNTFGCTYCKGSKKCVSDLNTNRLCPREDLASSSRGCGEDNSVENTRYRNRNYGDCSGVSDCKECLSSPGCYWCDTQKKCTSNINVYTSCRNDPKILNSLGECTNSNTLSYNPYEYANPRASSSTPSSGPSSGSSSGPSSGSSSGSSSTRLADTMSSIIPIVALSKDTNGNLSESSLKTIVDSMKRDGYDFSSNSGKQNALTVIFNQKIQLKQSHKNHIKEYVSNSLDYVSDGTSLSRAKDVEEKLKELDDLSRYIEAIKVEGFKEGFLDDVLGKEIIKNENIIESNTQNKKYIQMLWLANIVALGAFLYIR
jgi:hypothetical protein